MANSGEYYDHTTYPQTGAAGSSAAMRAELDTIEQAFNKLPSRTGNNNKLIKISPAGDSLDASAVFSDDGTNGAVSGDLFVAGGQIGQNAGQKHTIPAVANDTFALLAAAQAFTNKTIIAAQNTITTAASGNLAATELNAALAELQADIDTRATAAALNAHLNNVAGAHAASAISNTPAGNISATNVQAALNELDTEKLEKSGGTVNGPLTVNGALVYAGGLLQITGLYSVDYYCLTLGAGVGRQIRKHRTTNVIEFVNEDNTAVTHAFGNDGSFLIHQPAGFGYGTGAGGIVTQTTSKTTAVTLNRPTGQIITHNASLAAGATVEFVLNNTTIASGDILAVSNPSNANYSTRASRGSAGSATIYLKNESGAALGEAVTIAFAVIKSTTS